jgi:hypothetical protein
MADWYQNSRDGQLHMVKTWNTVFATSGQAWGIPAAHITQLATDAQAAEKNRTKGASRLRFFVARGRYCARSIYSPRQQSSRVMRR